MVRFPGDSGEVWPQGSASTTWPIAPVPFDAPRLESGSFTAWHAALVRPHVDSAITGVGVLSEAEASLSGEAHVHANDYCVPSDDKHEPERYQARERASDEKDKHDEAAADPLGHTAIVPATLAGCETRSRSIMAS